MSEATSTTYRQPVIGIKEEDLADLSTLTTSVDDLSEGLLSDITAKIVGMEVIPGGELKTDSNGREFITSDQLAIYLQVDDAEALGLENPNVTWYMNLPKVATINGVRKRVAPGKNSDYGVFLQNLEAFGISGNPQNAVRLQIKTVADLVGLHFRRQQKMVAFRDGSQRRQFEITEIYGFDNELRGKAGLKPVTLSAE